MKHILFILLVVGIVGCGDYEREKNNSGRNVSAPLLVRYRIDTVTVNRCQYIIVDHWHSGAIIHAGDCNNHGVQTLQDVLDDGVITNDNTIEATGDSMVWVWDSLGPFGPGHYRRSRNANSQEVINTPQH